MSNKFVIELKDPHGNKYPRIDNFIIAELNDNYIIDVSWDRELEEGLIQFRIYIDGHFCGYTRVRNVEKGYYNRTVRFDGFLINKGEVKDNYVDLEYASFKFASALISDEINLNSKNKHTYGTITLEAYRFCRKNEKLTKKNLWGNISANVNAYKSYNSTNIKDYVMRTKPGRTFVINQKMASFNKGYAYGDAIEIQTIHYDTAAHLINHGILNSDNERHKRIIDWAVKRANYRINGVYDDSNEFNSEIYDLVEEESLVVPPIEFDPYIDECDLLDGKPKWTRFKRKKDFVIMDQESNNEECVELNNNEIDVCDMTGSNYIVWKKIKYSKESSDDVLKDLLNLSEEDDWSL